MAVPSDEQGSLYEHIYDLFLDFTIINISQIAPTTGLGGSQSASSSRTLRLLMPDLLTWQAV